MRTQNQPKFHRGVVTLPSVDGVSWKVDGQDTEPGHLPQLEPGEKVTVEAVLDDGVVASGRTEWTFGVPADESSARVAAPAPAPQANIQTPPSTDSNNNE